MDWMKFLYTEFGSAGVHASRRPRSAVQPHIEKMEARALLSASSVTALPISTISPKEAFTIDSTTATRSELGWDVSYRDHSATTPSGFVTNFGSDEAQDFLTPTKSTPKFTFSGGVGHPTPVTYQPYLYSTFDDGIPLVAGTPELITLWLGTNGAGSLSIALADNSASLAPISYSTPTEFHFVVNSSTSQYVMVTATPNSGVTSGVWAVAASADIANVTDLNPSLVGTVPASVIAGAPLKLKEKLTFAAGNSPYTGKASANLLLSPDEIAADSVLTLASSSGALNLKAGKSKSLSLKFPKSLPTSIATGTYHLLIEVTDAAGSVTTIDSGQSLNVVAPVVDLSGSFVKVSAGIKPGKNFTATILVNNLSDATIPAVGVLPIDIETSSDDQFSGATMLEALTKSINLKPGKSLKINLSLTISASTDLFVDLDPAHTAFSYDTNVANEVFSQQIVVA